MGGLLGYKGRFGGMFIDLDVTNGLCEYVSCCVLFVLMVGADGREFTLKTGSYISESNKLDASCWRTDCWLRNLFHFDIRDLSIYVRISYGGNTHQKTA